MWIFLEWSMVKIHLSTAREGPTPMGKAHEISSRADEEERYFASPIFAPSIAATLTTVSYLRTHQCR